MKVKFLFFLLILFMLLPLIVATVYYLGNVTYDENIIVSKYIRAYDKETDSILNIELEEYILSVVAAEMPISFEFEALCAQAVAARSFAISKMLSNKESKYDVTLDHQFDQAYISRDKLKINWKDSYEMNIEKLEKVIDKTKGQILVYKGEIVNAYFHSTSSGMTQNSGDVWQRDYPYLVPAYSDESLSPRQKTEYKISYEDLNKKLEITDDKTCEISKIEISKKNESGYVLEVIIDDKVFSGVEVRKLLGLNSNAFDVSANDEKKIVTFTVYGYGHGIGMSQYGANKMAIDNFKYDEILKHYYRGVKIKNTQKDEL